MMIHSYEKGKRAEACIEYLEGSHSISECESVLLLPIPTTKDNSTVLNTDVYIRELFDTLNEKTVVSCYGLPKELFDYAQSKGARVIDLGEDEEFLVENAELTALCALGIFLNTAGYSPRGARVGIVGYGRIGKRLTNLFLYLGAEVRVFTSREKTQMDLSEYGIGSVRSSEDADLSGLDILINTAPAVIFRPDAVPKDLRVIDLASGDNFPGLAVEKYPSVPARMLPRSAGVAWGRAIERFIVNNS